jgi:hypothetical protein
MKDSEKIELWRQRYFEAQAAAEEFVLRRHGPEGLKQWIAANAHITARLLDAQRSVGQSKIKHFMTRLLDQLTLYDSQISLKETSGKLVLENLDCGILRYRMGAAAKGVELTFESPCQYCMSLNISIVQEYTANSTTVSCHLGERGCTWSAKDE